MYVQYLQTIKTFAWYAGLHRQGQADRLPVRNTLQPEEPQPLPGQVYPGTASARTSTPRYSLCQDKYTQVQPLPGQV